MRERSKFVLTGQGDVLFEYLRGTFNIECEARFPSHLIAMTGIGDTVDSVRRFCDAVTATDNVMDGGFTESEFISRPYPRFAMTLKEAAVSRLLSEELAPDLCVGRVSGEFIYGFPPGVPLLMPGEVITEDTVRLLSRSDVRLMLGGGRAYKGLIPVLP